MRVVNEQSKLTDLTSGTTARILDEYCCMLLSKYLPNDGGSRMRTRNSNGGCRFDQHLFRVLESCGKGKSYIHNWANCPWGCVERDERKRYVHAACVFTFACSLNYHLIPGVNCWISSLLCDFVSGGGTKYQWTIRHGMKFLNISAEGTPQPAAAPIADGKNWVIHLDLSSRLTCYLLGKQMVEYLPEKVSVRHRKKKYLMCGTLSLYMVKCWWVNPLFARVLIKK